MQLTSVSHSLELPWRLTSTVSSKERSPFAPAAHVFPSADIFANSFISKSLPIGYAHMQILIHDSTTGSSVSSSADSNLTYLYR